jgi:hypothetical protein
MTTIPLDSQFYEWEENPKWLARSKYRAAAGLSNGLSG